MVNQKINGARILLECLYRLGVRDVFGYPGGTVIPIYDEIYKYEKINEDMKEKMKAITLNDLIKATKSINKEESKENILISDKEKYSSCKMESNTNVSDNVSNINSGIDIEEKKKHLKNQLDEFLNSNDDEDDGDDFEVEITKG